ncbi:MAG: tRNA 2-thiocytidine(32) synthetase TtcA [Myxococcota bacterium]
MANRAERLTKDLARSMGRCIRDFDLVEPGDRIMVCLSGGKDSYTLLHLLERARARAPVPFDLIAVHLDQGHPGYDGRPLEAWLRARGADYRILREDTHAIVTDRVPEGKTYCSLCSRLRRGVLYNAAEELGCTKIALGHHRDDAVETLLLNLMFSGSLGSMPPKLVTKDGRNTVIRPLLYCSESAIAELAEALRFPILPCDLCGSQDNLWRQQVKRLLDDLEARIPNVRDSMLAAMTHVRPSHLLDATLWKSLGLAAAPRDDDGRDGDPPPKEAPDPADGERALRRLPLLS